MVVLPFYYLSISVLLSFYYDAYMMRLCFSYVDPFFKLRYVKVFFEVSALVFVVEGDHVEEFVAVFFAVFVEGADDAAGVACGDAVGRDVAVDEASGADDAVVADGDVGEDDAPAAYEAVFSYADGTVDDRLGVAVGEVTDDARGGVVGDKCHVETYGGVVADGYKVGLGGEDDGRDGRDEADIVADFNTEGLIVGNGVNTWDRNVGGGNFQLA